MKRTLTIADLPSPLQEKAQRICHQENINPEQIQFTRRNRHYYAMTMAGQNTGWGYYPKTNDID